MCNKMGSAEKNICKIQLILDNHQLSPLSTELITHDKLCGKIECEKPKKKRIGWAESEGKNAWSQNHSSRQMWKLVVRNLKKKWPWTNYLESEFFFAHFTKRLIHCFASHLIFYSPRNSSHFLPRFIFKIPFWLTISSKNICWTWIKKKISWNFPPLQWAEMDF